jgi:hypothetical protein
MDQLKFKSFCYLVVGIPQKVLRIIGINNKLQVKIRKVKRIKKLIVLAAILLE